MKLINRFTSLISRLANRYGYRIERIVDYSKHQLDVFEILIDQLTPSSSDFFLVQVGANDGRTGDPIYEFIERYHWRSLLLEPQPEVFKQLVENYRNEPQLILENVALGETDGTLTMYTVKGSSYLGSFDRDALVKRVRDSSNIVEIAVEVATFHTLVDRHKIDHVDLLLVDTEGYDFEVIKMALQDGLPKPSLIRYEHLHLSTPDRKACVQLLASHGYQLLRDGRDTMAYRKETNSNIAKTMDLSSTNRA